MPLLQVHGLQTLQDQERGHLVLSMLAHAFIVGFPKTDALECILPACIAVPWYQISQILGLKPVVTYASLELANFKLLDASLPPNLDNLAILHTFTGSFDEAWFYLVPLAIEATGAPALQAIMDAQSDINTQNTDKLSIYLGIVRDKLGEMTALLKRMYEKNDPYIFWNRVRPYSGMHVVNDLYQRWIQECASASLWIIL